MPAIGQKAPEFQATAVVGGEIKQISLSEYTAKGKYVVLFFYPRDFTFVCPTEINGFNDSAAKFREKNCELLACSTDSEFSHLAWTQVPRKKGGLGETVIPLVADTNMAISRAYGVLDEPSGAAFRGLFIIDGKGILRQITVNDMGVGRSVDETLRLVEAFQFHDKHGEVCPLNWKPGDATMKPDTKGSAEYFKKLNDGREGQ